MKHMKSLFEFAKLRDILKTKDKELSIKCNKNFINNERLIYDIFLERHNKHIFLKWNDNENHDMIQKIKTRTSFCSTSEFNDFMEFAFNNFFDEKLKYITKNGRYSLYFPNNKFYLIINIKYDNIFSKYTLIYISTITLSSSDNMTDSFEINDDIF